jgi:hypothetical protein
MFVSGVSRVASDVMYISIYFGAANFKRVLREIPLDRHSGRFVVCGTPSMTERASASAPGKETGRSAERGDPPSQNGRLREKLA